MDSTNPRTTQPRLLYVSLMRMPTEKAHGLQIAQNCEAFANAGYRVRLWATRRVIPAEMRQVRDYYAYYGVRPNFRIERLPTLDLMPLAGGNTRIERFLFPLIIVSFALVMLLRLLFTQADVYYARDESLLLLLSLIKPRRKLAYEVHQYKQGSRLGAWLQTQVCQRVGHILPITAHMAHDLIQTRGAQSEQILVAPDGIRAARFADRPTQAPARAQLGLAQGAFIVGYVGRLHMMGIDKGVGLLMQAMQAVPDAIFLLVGGPEQMAATLQAQWHADGHDPARFMYVGSVAPDAVPQYLAALDVGVVPLPDVPEYAYYNSPLKLFEYMAAGLAVIASDLPSIRDVLQPEQNGLLYPPGDAEALAAALRRLQHDPALRRQMAQKAQQDAFGLYTWDARAERILAHIRRETGYLGGKP